MKINFKKILSLVFCLVPFGVYAQTQWSDDFNDNNFTGGLKSWSGIDTAWTVTSQQLNSFGPNATGTVIYLSTPSTAASDVQWEFYANPKFATSSSNYIDVFLISDIADLTGNNSGYFVRIGGTPDEVSLFVKQGAAVTKIIDGTDAFIDGSSDNPTKIKVVRTASFEWTLSADPSGTGSNYFTQGVPVINSTISTSSYFGVLVKYSSSNFNKHYFDDFNVGPITADNIPPVITKLITISSNQLDVIFNESVDLASAQNVANYIANKGLGNPSTAVRDAANFNIVHLTFGTSFVDGTYYLLNVNNIQDLKLNTMSPYSDYFDWFVVKPPVYKDVIINEIYPAPSSTSPIPNEEWVEIYNRSSKAIELDGWKFSSTSGNGALTKKILGPGKYLILCKTESSFLAFGDAMKISVPTLNNSGSRLSLIDNSGNIIDSVAYKSSWYAPGKETGWSLELKNPDFNSNCPPDANWESSNSNNQATPGTQNSNYSNLKDTIGPKINSINATDPTHVDICFDEPMDEGLLASVSSYFIDNGIGQPDTVYVDPSLLCVTLTLSSSLINQTNYNLTVSNLTDCSGNTATAGLNSLFSYYIVKPYDIVINELMPDPDPANVLPPAVEWVELYNKTDYRINLNDWNFITRSSTSSTTNIKPIPDVTIEPKGYIVLASPAGAAALKVAAGSSLPVAVIESFQSLTNSGAKLELQTSSGSTISLIEYSDSWYRDADKAAGGWSLEQVDPLNPCAGQNNWIASKDAIQATPGRVNSVNASNPDTKAPELDKIVVINVTKLKVYFNEPLDSSSATNISTYTIDNGIGVASVDPIQPDYKAVYLYLTTDVQAGTTYNLTVSSTIKDCAGNPVAAYNSGKFALPEAVDSFDVIINEILYNPRTGGVDFVELYNRSNKVINLKDVSLSSIDTVTGNLTSVNQIDSVGYLLFPDSYVVLTTQPDSVRKQYPLLIDPKPFIKMSLPSFNISDGRVVISRSDKKILDRFAYNDNMHLGLLTDRKGISLERLSPNRETQDRGNWHSAAQTVGFATPGYKNSQFVASENDGSEIKLDPEIFSPDEDGHNDVLNIHYKFDSPGFVATVNIYDARGRHVRRLINNELVGAEGVFTWDGITEEKYKARIGIYIILFEAFDASGNTKKHKKTCVLGGNLRQ